MKGGMPEPPPKRMNPGLILPKMPALSDRIPYFTPNRASVLSLPTLKPVGAAKLSRPLVKNSIFRINSLLWMALLFDFTYY